MSGWSHFFFFYVAWSHFYRLTSQEVKRKKAVNQRNAIERRKALFEAGQID